MKRTLLKLIIFIVLFSFSCEEKDSISNNIGSEFSLIRQYYDSKLNREFEFNNGTINELRDFDIIDGELSKIWEFLYEDERVSTIQHFYKNSTGFDCGLETFEYDNEDNLSFSKGWYSTDGNCSQDSVSASFQYFYGFDGIRDSVIMLTKSEHSSPVFDNKTIKYYDQNENLSELRVFISGELVSFYKYESDDQKNPFEGIIGFYRNGKNNLLKIIRLEGNEQNIVWEHEYNYNVDGYPVNFTRTEENGSVTNIEYEYIE